METTAVERSEPFDVGRAFRHGWGAIQRCLPILWVGGCIRACTNGGGGGGGGGGGSPRSGSLFEDGPAFPAQASDLLSPMFGGSDPSTALGAGMIAFMVAGGLVLLAMLWMFNAWFLSGWISVQSEIVRTGQGSFGTLFGTLAPFRRMLVWTLLKGLVMALCLLVVAVPLVGLGFAVERENIAAAVVAGMFGLGGLVGVIYVMCGLHFGGHAVVLDGAEPLEALGAAWAAVDGRRLALVFFAVIVGLGMSVFALSGVLACVIGLAVTVPLATAWLDLSLTEAYLRLTRPAVEADGWVINRM